MYVCLHVCVCVRTFVCVRVCGEGGGWTCVCKYIYVTNSMRCDLDNALEFVCLNVCVCLYICVWVCVCVCMCVCMYIYSANPTRCDLDDALACVYVIRKKKRCFPAKEPYKSALYGLLSYMVYTMLYIIHKRALCFCKTALYLCQSAV